MFRRLCQRERLLLTRSAAEWVNPLLFYAVVALMFPLTLPAASQHMQSIAPGVLWVGALLANVWLMDDVFSSDYRRGILLHYCMVDGLIAYVWVKVGLRCLFFCVPMLMVTPIVAIMYHLDAHTVIVMMVALLLGSPSMAWLSALCSSMVLSSRQASVLSAVILFPMYVPIMVFGAGSATHANQPLLFLVVILLCVIALVPAVTAWLLRQQLCYQ